MKLVLGILGCLVSLNLSAATFSQAKAVYAKFHPHIPLIFDRDSEANAYTDGRAVYIKSGMLRFVRNLDELAFVLGHELGHGHCWGGWNGEYCADSWGVKLAYEAGFNGCSGAIILKRFNGGRTHPPGNLRWEHVRCGK